MMTMTPPQTPLQEAPTASAAHAALFSELEVVEAVVVPDLDPSMAAPVFSSTY